MNEVSAGRDLCADDRRLISIDEACRRTASHAMAIEGSECVQVVEAVDRVLAVDLSARIALPRFEQSAMDGYAFAAADASTITTSLKIVSCVAAGSIGEEVPAGSAARVLTGAPIPRGADTVIMQEHVTRAGSSVRIEGPVRPGSNVRRRGEDICQGELLLRAGQRLAPHHIALLAAQGMSEVRVGRRPRIAVVSTGNELRQQGEALGAASVFDSNRPMLLSLMRQARLDARDGGLVHDSAGALARHLCQLAEGCDLIVTTGGASEGDEDHLAKALALCEASFETLRLALKPGKPAVAGHLGRTAYLGLPGNPVAALVSWLLLGNALVATLSGLKPRRAIGYPMRLASGFQHKPGRTEFAPARTVGGRVEILGRGGSARLKPMIHADGLAEIASSAGELDAGEYVLFHPFGGGFNL